MDRPARRRDGAAPEELLPELDSEVYHLRLDVNRMQGDAREVEKRLRAIEVDVGHVARLVKFSGTVVSGLLISGIGAVVALLLRR